MIFKTIKNKVKNKSKSQNSCKYEYIIKHTVDIILFDKNGNIINAETCPPEYIIDSIL